MNCFYSETRPVLWGLRVAAPEAVPCSPCQGLPELRGVRLAGHSLVPGLQPARGSGPQLAVISEEMDTKQDTGQGGVCLQWFLGLLRTCSLPMFWFVCRHLSLGCCSVLWFVSRGSIRESSTCAIPGSYLGIFTLF